MSAPWRTEYDVISTLRALGHEVRPLGVHDDLGDIRRASEEWKPHIAFNLLEGFDDISIFDQNVVSHLELLKLSYTGCNPRGLLLARDKSLSKKLLAYHRIAVPGVRGLPDRPADAAAEAARFPADREVADAGSLDRHLPGVGGGHRREAEGARDVHSPEHRHGRHRRAVHRGRELYVGIIGNQTLQALPVWELFFTNMPPDAKRIATDRVKWSVKYQKKYGIESGLARDLPEGGGRPDSARVQARVPRAGAERVRAHRPAVGQRRTRLGARSQSRTRRSRKGEDFAASADEDRHRLRVAAAANRQSGDAVAAGKRRVKTRRRRAAASTSSGALSWSAGPRGSVGAM